MDAGKCNDTLCESYDAAEPNSCSTWDNITDCVKLGLGEPPADDKTKCTNESCGAYNETAPVNCSTYNAYSREFKQPPGRVEPLAERGAVYGSYSEQCRISQSIKRAMMDSPNWVTLSDDKKEALEIIAVKIGRILNGDPEYGDSWHDIAGYAKLVEDSLS